VRIRQRAQVQEKLAQQKDVKGAAAEPARHDQRKVGVKPAKVAEEQVDRHQRHFAWQHQRAEEDDEQQVFPRPAQAREGKRNQ
jgi:hypothetical protein